MKRLVGLLVLALALASPVSGQQQIVCGGVRLPLAPGLPPVRDSVLKRVADSIPCIRTQNRPSTELRNRLALRTDSLSRRVPKVDTVLPPQPPADTSVVRVDVSPSSGPSVVVDSTVQFSAACFDAQGAARACTVAWRSGNPPVATVNTTGLARGVSPGFADVYATTTAGLSGVSRLEVRGRPTQPPDSTPPIPPGGGTWTRVIANQRIIGDLVVTPSESVLIGPGVEVQGNVVVYGVLGMRPGSALTFLGADPNAYVGSGLQFSDAVKSDIGLWAADSGRFDFSCTPKRTTGTGSDPTWLPGDEYWIAPTDVGDFRARRWSPGQPIPRASPLVPPAEIVNATRDCSINGPGHIHMHSTKPQKIEYVRLYRMGVSNTASAGPVKGRYALHFHESVDGSRGSVVRGVVCVECRGKVFVPHSSHGITMVDNASVNSWSDGMWWDLGDMTNDLLIDRMTVLGVQMPDSVAGGQQSSYPAFTLGAGLNMTIRNSVAAAVYGGTSTAVCFDWPEPTTVFHRFGDPKLVWLFEDNVGHNCRGPSVRFWTNLQDDHIVTRHTSYRNGVAAVENGAYFSGTEYHGLNAFEDGFQYGGGVNESAGFYNNASATLNTQGRVMQLTNCNVTSKDGPAFKVGHRQLPATHHMLIQDCTFTSQGNPRAVGVPFDVWPKVWVSHAVNPWLAHFIRTNVLPEDITFDDEPGNNGSEILIDHADGRKWSVTFQNGVKVTTPREE